MIDSRSENTKRNEPANRRGFAVWIIVGVAVISFVLGGLFFGDGAGHDESHASTGAETEPSAWTCSMHPQIQLPEPGKCPLCFMDLIPVSAGGEDELDPSQLRMSPTAKQLARIETTEVRRAFAEREIRMVGRVAYDETRLAHIAARVPGRLDRLYVDFTGMRVREGDRLVSIYSPDLLAAQQELLAAAEAIGALNRSSSPVLKSTAEATREAAREKLRLLGLSRQQIAQIESSGAASDHLTLNAPIGGVVIGKDAREGMYVETGSRIYTITDLSRLWVLLEAYESDLPWLRYGQTVSFESASFPGESFEATISFIDPVVDPTTRTVQVRAIVDNDDLRLKPDMFIRGVVSSRVDAAGDVVDPDLAGKWIGPMHPEIVKDGPGQCDVCGMDLVPAESLGYAAKADADRDAPLLIPVTAPLVTGRRAVVYVELPNDDGPLFEGREVELGPRAGEFYVVRSGLEEGESVVTNGAFRIDSELQIQARPSMMAPSGGAPSPGHNHEPSVMDNAIPGPSHAGHPDAPRPVVTQAVLDALAPVYESYFAVQMALAKDDHAAAVESASGLRREVAGVDMTAFDDAGHEVWMTLMATMRTAAGKIAESADIESARSGFLDLSNAAIELQATFGHGGDQPYYLTYCPMAFDNAGAYWLQTEDIVWNSYWGEAMLRCGEIKKPLPSVNAETE